MTIKKYWVVNDLLNENEASLDDIKLIESLNRMDLGKREFIKVLKFSDLKKEIDTTFSKYEDKIWHFTRKGNETLHELKGELEKNLFGSENEVPSSSSERWSEASFRKTSNKIIRKCVSFDRHRTHFQRNSLTIDKIVNL